MSEKTTIKCHICGKELGEASDVHDENWAVCQIVGQPPNQEERYYCRVCIQPKTNEG